jgi:hypothetical protein
LDAFTGACAVMTKPRSQGSTKVMKHLLRHIALDGIDLALKPPFRAARDSGLVRPPAICS